MKRVDEKLSRNWSILIFATYEIKIEYEMGYFSVRKEMSDAFRNFDMFAVDQILDELSESI